MVRTSGLQAEGTGNCVSVVEKLMAFASSHNAIGTVMAYALVARDLHILGCSAMVSEVE